MKGAALSLSTKTLIAIMVIIQVGWVKAQGIMGEQEVHGSVVRALDKQADGAVVEEVVLHVKENATSDKYIERKGRLVYYDNAQATVLIMHGFMCDKFDVGFLRSLFPRPRFNSLTFDFRAHGEDSKGQCCTFGRDEAFDVIAAAVSIDPEA